MKKQCIFSLNLLALLSLVLLNCSKKKDNPDPGVSNITSLTITAINPTSGAEGTKVVITGTGFSATISSNIVKFGTVTATVDSASTTRLVTKVPIGATNGKVSVETGGKTTTSSNEFTVVLNPPAFGAANTNSVTNITTSSASVGSTLTTKGSGNISQYGHVWSKTNNQPSLTDSKSELGALPANTSFPYTIQSDLKNLEANTTYFVRGYAITGTTSVYGEAFQLKTAAIALPTFDNSFLPRLLSSTTTTATITGNVNGQGGASVTQHGFVYGEQTTVNEPVIDKNTKTELGALSGAFPYTLNATLKDLKPNTTYNFRVFATNSGGTSYGPLASFKTQQQGASVDFDGTILLGQGNSMLAVDARTGAKKWDFKTANINARMDLRYPVIVGSSAFFSDGHKLYRLNYTTQEKIWEFSLPVSSGSPETSSPAFDNGRVHIIQHGKLISVNASQGTRAGQDLTLGVSGGSGISPIAGTGILYINLGTILTSVSSASEVKQSLWKTTLITDDILGKIALADGIIVGPTPIGRKVLAYDAANGNKKWEYSTNQYAEDGVPTIAEGVVYLPGSGAIFHAIDLKTGVKKWTFKNPYNQDITNIGAAVNNGVVYVSMPKSVGGTLFALDAATGVKKWEVNIATLNTPVVVGNIIYVTGRSNVETLYALNKSDGSIIWKLELPCGCTISAPTIVDASGNTVYYPAESGMKQ